MRKTPARGTYIIGEPVSSLSVEQNHGRQTLQPSIFSPRKGDTKNHANPRLDIWGQRLPSQLVGLPRTTQAWLTLEPCKRGFCAKHMPHATSRAPGSFQANGTLAKKSVRASEGQLQKVVRRFSPQLQGFGVSAQIGSGVVRGGHEVRFHQGSTRVPRGSARAAGWCEHKKEHRMLLGISPDLIVFLFCRRIVRLGYTWIDSSARP